MPESTEYTEWQRPLSGLYSIMMVKSAQPGEGGGCTPTPFHSIYHHKQSCGVYAAAERADSPSPPPPFFPSPILSFTRFGKNLGPGGGGGGGGDESWALLDRVIGEDLSGLSSDTLWGHPLTYTHTHTHKHPHTHTHTDTRNAIWLWNSPVTRIKFTTADISLRSPEPPLEGTQSPSHC